jgi:NitT/TauT family transport system ATP-binding protein
VRLTDVGQDFATTTILRSKDLFRPQGLTYVPVLSSDGQTLRGKRSGSMRAAFFLDLWDEHFPHEETERQFATTVNWERYAELFEYDASEDRIYLPEPIAVNSNEE